MSRGALAWEEVDISKPKPGIKRTGGEPMASNGREGSNPSPGASALIFADGVFQIIT